MTYSEITQNYKICIFGKVLWHTTIIPSYRFLALSFQEKSKVKVFHGQMMEGHHTLTFVLYMYESMKNNEEKKERDKEA